MCFHELEKVQISQSDRQTDRRYSIWRKYKWFHLDFKEMSEKLILKIKYLLELSSVDPWFDVNRSELLVNKDSLIDFCTPEYARMCALKKSINFIHSITFIDCCCYVAVCCCFRCCCCCCSCSTCLRLHICPSKRAFYPSKWPFAIRTSVREVYIILIGNAQPKKKHAILQSKEMPCLAS